MIAILARSIDGYRSCSGMRLDHEHRRLFLYIRPMERSENSSGYSMNELTGLIGEVLVPIPVVGFGEVMVKAGAGLK